MGKTSESKIKVPQPVLIGDGVIEDLESDEPEVFKPSGIKPLDELILGAVESELTLIAGPPSRGKTALAIQWLLYTAQNDGMAGILSMEMSRLALRNRLLSSVSGVPMSMIRQKAWAGPAQRKLVLEWADWLATLPLSVDDRGGMDPDNVYATLVKWKEWGVKLAVIDYVQQMTGANDSRVVQVGDAVRAIKAAAKDAKLPVIALSAVNRAGAADNRPPKLSDLRDSGDLEFVSDTILMFHYPEDDEFEDIRVADIHVLKQRNGPTGIVPVQFNKPATRFEERTL